MDRNKLRDQLSKIIENCAPWNTAEMLNQMIALVEPELEKAGMWDRVKGIAERYGVLGCEDCPIAECPGGFVCKHAKIAIDAIEGVSHDKQ